jgi:hypothetical protein
LKKRISAKKAKTKAKVKMTSASKKPSKRKSA